MGSTIYVLSVGRLKKIYFYSGTERKFGDAKEEKKFPFLTRDL